MITGASGFLGSELVSKLSLKNHVYALVRNKHAANTANVTFVNINLRSFNELQLGDLKVDAVYYLAQSRRYQDFPASASDMLEVNVAAAVNMAEWARKNQVKRFIYASSGGIYDLPNEPMREDANIQTPHKLGYYFGTKLAAEILLKCYAQYFQTFVIIRPFFLYGPGQNPTMFIPRIINSVATGKEIFLSSEEGIRVNPIFISDAAMACEKIMYLEGNYIFNIAGSEVISLKSLALMIAEIIGKPPFFVYNAQYQKDVIANIELMRKFLHTPSVVLKDGIKRVIQSLNIVT
ncbi:MAG TPA: NAD(P)-dependent oxidoreductase [Chitinophagales bacterium]|nr:NAD(P)-dependent oxidoreductase [Chitinophagales bacterium]